MKVGIIGAGAMGTGIAQVAAMAGHEVLIYDSFPQAMQKSRDRTQKLFNRLVEKGKFGDQYAKQLIGQYYYVENLETLKDCGLIIEAVIENLEIKQKIFKEIDAYCPSETILASNTSSLSIASIAAACSQPERVIGLHFFNPAPLMKLVEVVPAVQSSETFIRNAYELMERWGKIPVIAKDTPGFIVNRVARPFYGEALRILEEGIADEPTIDWAMTELAGFRMGPFTLMDYIGNDVNYTVTETVYTSFYNDPRYRPSFTQKRLSEAGYLGRKSGRGYYDYSDGAINPAANKDEMLGRKIADRIIYMLINEAADALFWNVATAKDIDLAMTKGVNYPKGLLKWADEIGIKQCVEYLDDLYDRYREDRYRCSPLLRDMAKKEYNFF